ncbi:diguanylate cyclase [Pseudomonas sp. CAN2814]|uniref:diguanylate cyclase domain-containing protein n=1 Tax=Pseudomonas sp. CAN1 TaxID=3046726 RepID=UPI0026478E81|nr:diguanylate cyclase [Pseudomonas sp. CAN1]MDN6860020.1 diguanylate cyclase [Pseudomonas sp. CAN1]
MKIDRLVSLYEELKIELEPDGIDIFLYYYHNELWNDITSSPVNAQTTINLQKSKQEEISLHTSSSYSAWFYLEDVDATVRLRFNKSPQKGTRLRYRNKILRIKENSTNAYRVAHHHLTNLLAKDAFKEKLSDALKEVNQDSSNKSDTQEINLPKTLAILALDIDHFKQINDTWGHLYGDQVLKTFGMRLEACANKIKDGLSAPLSIHLGHPSGEEFLILILARATRETFIEWGNEFRLCICEQILPLEDEWTILSSSENLSTIIPPPIPERRVSTSIGLTIHSNTSKSESITDISSTLLDRADTALYRAKASGRNQVIAYDDILSTCGRVLEQDQNARIIAIDIGANVGVSLGQEFKVYLPTFSGTRSFIINDGRTTRTLGLYPRVESARIVVFDVQAEISFAYISSPEDTEKSIERESHLEAIPAGSIGHLLPNASRYFPAAPDSLSSGGLQAAQNFLDSLIEQKREPYSAVIRFSNEQEYIKKYGTAALNIALAKLYRSAQIKFHTTQKTEILDRGSICIIGPNQSYNEPFISSFADEFANEFPETGTVAGVFSEQDRAGLEAEIKTEIAATNSIEYSRFAASELGRSEATRIRHFSHDTATSVLQALRLSRSFETAYADYEHLILLGIKSAATENLAALISDGLGKYKQAYSHYKNAYNMEPDNLIIKGNYGITLLYFNEIDAAINLFNTLTSEDIRDIHELHPLAFVAYAQALAKAKIQGSSNFNETKFLVLAKDAILLPQAKEHPEIQEALSMRA